MTVHQSSGAYYDPYDLGINLDPYPVYRRLRDEAPVYYNEQHDFYAVSCYDDVERGLVDKDHFSNARSDVLEFIKAGVEFPSGIFIFEDPPLHTVHRGLISRVFTPRKMAAIEPQVRDYCVQALDRLVGRDHFDFVRDLGAQMPMRVIGMLLGIPEGDQAAIRDHVDASISTDPGEPINDLSALAGDIFAEYIDWRAEHPSDDLMTELLNVEFEDETGTVRRLGREEILTYVSIIAGAGNETTTKLIGWTGRVLADHPDQRRLLVEEPGLIANAIEEVLRYEPPGPARRAVRRPRRRVRRRNGPGGQRAAVPGRLGQSRRAAVDGPRHLRCPPGRGRPPHLQLRDPLLPRRGARPPRRTRRARRGVEALPRVDGGRGERQARVQLDGPRLGDPPGRRAVTTVKLAVERAREKRGAEWA